MKIYFIPILLILNISLFSQREHISSEEIRFTIIDAEYLDSNDGAIIPNITTGFRPFSYIWYGPDNFVSTDSILKNVEYGKYYLRIEDALCGKFSDTIEIEPISNSYETPNDIFIKEVSPNPFIDYIKIEIESEAKQTISIRLFHSSGNLFFERTFNLVIGTQTVELSGLNWMNGIYLVQICNNNRCHLTKRLIKVD